MLRRVRAIRSRVTYANVAATIALFVALGGGAYAVTGIPDRGGVFHGCVNAKTGALRVVKAATSCRKARTVHRGKRRVRIPGESAIAWNQQGPRGATGLNGVDGVNGVNGATNVVVRTTTVDDTGSTMGQAIQSVQCNAGERAIGGGAGRSDGTNRGGDTIQTSFPTVVSGSTATPAPPGSTPTGWRSAFSFTTQGPVIVFYAICASP